MDRRESQVSTPTSPFDDLHQFESQQQPSRTRTSERTRPSYGRGGDPFDATIDEEVSPRTESPSSIQQQIDLGPTNTMSDDKRESKNGMTPSNSQFFSEHYSPAINNEGAMPDAASPPAVDYSPTQEMRSPSYATDIIPQLSPNDIGQSSKVDDQRLYASRPGFGRMTSDQPLMGDVSGANTPIDGLKPNPFDNTGDLSPASAHSSRDTSPELVAIGPTHLVPKIHLNSNPTSPDPAHVASFDPRPSFAAPFNDDLDPHAPASPATSRARKTVSIAESSVQFDTQKYTDANPTSIAARRSMRMKTQQDRLSGISKKSNGSDGNKKEKNGQSTNRKPFQSTRLKGDIYKPWLDKRDPAQRWAKYITLASIIIGIGAAAACK